MAIVIRISAHNVMADIRDGLARSFCFTSGCTGCDERRTKHDREGLEQNTSLRCNECKTAIYREEPLRHPRPATAKPIQATFTF